MVSSGDPERTPLPPDSAGESTDQANSAVFTKCLRNEQMKGDKIVLAGGKGFLGNLLRARFTQKAFEVVILTREPKGGEGKELYWDALTLGHWKESIEGSRALINLTGRSVNCRYNEKNRREIMDSRVDSTRVLGAAVAGCANPPKVWLNASTATIYRHSISTPTEESSTDFTATPEAKDAFSIQVAQAWERAFEQVPIGATRSTRRVALRMGMVLDIQQGTVFRVLRRLATGGLGGKMGNGEQYVSWIHGLDFCRAIEWVIEHDELTGPINISAPNPLPNNDLMAAFRRVCHRRFGLPATKLMLEIGAFFLRTETELVLKSRRVIPGRLLQSGFEFQFPMWSE